MAQPRSGLADVLAATAIAGAASYLITWLVPRVIGFDQYAVFAVFWAALYLVVGTLAGLQQEVARGTLPADPHAPERVNKARNFGVVTAVLVASTILVTAPAWAGVTFPAGQWPLVIPLAVGSASYALVAVLGGTLQGLGRWRATALLIVSDAVLRVAAMGIVLVVTHDLVALAWAAALPFGVAIVLVWPLVRSRVVGKAQLDVGYRRLTWNVSRTVTAAAATGVMVSGFPLIFGIAANDRPAAIVGMVVLAVTLVRAPLVVVAMALQAWLLVRFRDHSAAAARLLALSLVVILGLGAAIAVVGWAVGPPVFAWLFPDEPVPSAGFLAGLVASSALVAALVVTGAALLARSQHHSFTAGWVVGAVVTIGATLLPWEPEPLALAALLAGPLAGLLVHGAALVIARGGSSASEEPALG